MKIVVLDGHTLNPGDLSWAELEALGSCCIYPRTAPQEVIARAAGAAVAVVNKVELSAAVLAELSDLRYVGVTATGYNIVDVAAARRRGIVVTNVPTYGTPSVAQMVFAHLLNLTQRAADHARGVADGRWSESADWCYWDYPLVELAGLTMGIVGLGRISRAVAEIARAFGMRVIAYDVAPARGDGGSEGDSPLFADHRCATVPGKWGQSPEMVELDRLFRESDVVSLHCPLTLQSERLVSRERLALMKPTAYLINTSRGPLVDEPALAEALAAGRIAGAGLDVLSIEPSPPDHPLLRAKNCFITPHIAWATRAARARLLAAAVENVKAFLAGRPQNVVNS